MFVNWRGYFTFFFLLKQLVYVFHYCNRDGPLAFLPETTVYRKLTGLTASRRLTAERRRDGGSRPITSFQMISYIKNIFLHIER